MSQLRMGELLGQLANLSHHDIEEILDEQKTSRAGRRRFGDIALAWGLCEPAHVWQAWCQQLLSRVQTIDLDSLGVDAQAAALVHSDVAHRLSIIPIRCFGDTLIIAATGDTAGIAAELSLVTGKKLRFVQADPMQIQQALQRYFPPGPAAA